MEHAGCAGKSFGGTLNRVCMIVRESALILDRTPDLQASLKDFEPSFWRLRQLNQQLARRGVSSDWGTLSERVERRLLQILAVIGETTNSILKSEDKDGKPEAYFEAGCSPASVSSTCNTVLPLIDAVPSACTRFPIRPSTRACNRMISPGFALPRIFEPRIAVSLRPGIGGMTGSLCATTPANCAAASTNRTPGIMGRPGKCPRKNGSAPRTAYSPGPLFPGSRLNT